MAIFIKFLKINNSTWPFKTNNFSVSMNLHAWHALSQQNTPEKVLNSQDSVTQQFIISLPQQFSSDIPATQRTFLCQSRRVADMQVSRLVGKRHRCGGTQCH